AAASRFRNAATMAWSPRVEDDAAAVSMLRPQMWQKRAASGSSIRQAEHSFAACASELCARREESKSEIEAGREARTA
ncbi:MAG TPA: hypothetical protein VNB89_05590, partial [Gemmatimonadaceae bacterium]|nr:hypothetical protein [Gemmatimonadaceae bacterium]